MKLFPVLLDLSCRPVMVIGSTPEAEDLAKSISAYAGRLTVLSESPSASLKDFCQKQGIRLLEKCYSREDLYGQDLVFLASSSKAVTRDAAAICRTMGIMLYVAGSPGRSDFALP